MRTLLTSVLLALVGAHALGCSPTRSARRDAAMGPDAGASDAPVIGIDAPFPDAFLGLDAYLAAIPDAFVELDAPMPRDAGTDAPSVRDAYISPDAFAARDAYVAADAYVARDAFARDAYVAGDAGPSTTFSYTGALASYVVPAGVTSLRIVAEGASGGDAAAASTTYIGGHGARVEAIVTVTPGETLSILVGERPEPIAYLGDGCGASGGGGTFVVRGPATALVVAGGGGGAAAYSSYSINGADASLTADGVSSGTLLGGTGGAGGQAVSYEGGGGGGLSGDGMAGEGFGGMAFTSGGAGGARATSESCGASPAGGFGGGGGGGNDMGAGGGGYSGGAGQTASMTGVPAGGGGSYVSGTSTSVTIRATHGHGSVTLTPR